MPTSTMNRDAQLSSLANVAYLKESPQKVGDWRLIQRDEQLASGFFGVAYVNDVSKQVVVAFRGTNDLFNDIKPDIGFVTGAWSQQFTDAAAFTANIESIVAAEKTLQNYQLLTTGHSLGGGLAQVVGQMFGLSGASYDAPGALKVTQNPQYEAVKAQYASGVGGQIAPDFTNYRVEGSVISGAGTTIGPQRNMVSLAQSGVVGFTSAALMLAGVSTGGLGGLLSTILGYAGANIDNLHSMDGIERMMHIAAGLEKALDSGGLRTENMLLSKATGKTGGDIDSTDPQVVVFKDSNNQVKAYLQQHGEMWKLSTIDQQTSITLTPSSTPGQAPVCIVQEANQPAYSCVVSEEWGVTSRVIDDNNDGQVDQVRMGVDTNNDGSLDKFVSTGDNQYSLLNTDWQITQWRTQGLLGEDLWNDYTSWSTSQLVNDNLTEFGPVNYSLYDPIGAFYESKSAGNDNAGSIAYKTFRILGLNNEALTATQLATYDTNKDGKISGTEVNGLKAWVDETGDGVNQSGELQGLREALGNAGHNSIRASDYAFYTRGNATLLGNNPVQEPVNTAVPVRMVGSSTVKYRALRDGDPRFMVNAQQWIDWAPTDIKITSDQKNMVGTDGNDAFDSHYYDQYDGKYFNLSLIENFYAGDGNDTMGGSSRNDNLAGGTGNDSLLGYEGDDVLYGEEGQDELHGGAGNDKLDSGIDDDKLFGDAGNDAMNGGDGNDAMLGFTASNEAKQTLDAGETDDDVMFGGAGDDLMGGGFGNDIMDGGVGSDILTGDDGNDTVFGGDGDDEVNGNNQNDLLSGGQGADKILGGVGNDTLYGGDGNDLMTGFTGSNEIKKTLDAGETDDDVMFGGNGDDYMLGAWGNDLMLGGNENDELQGGEGQDALYGESGNDRLFGGAGNDTLYGGTGDDLMVGGVAVNETPLANGVSDSNFMYGGEGNDTMVGGIGNDYIDGGVGADDMEGGQGDDTYIVNSVNDVILEQANEGYDSVVSSSNYILNANIEQLKLVEGFNINGTGNRLNNTIIGNSQDNILDGVTGADTMIGGLGNETYYVDNTGDKLVELQGEGTDTVNASISYTLGANLENLTLLDFSKPEKGLADGVNILVYGYPKAFELDYMQGNAVEGYRGTCALTSIANLSTQASKALSEFDVVQRAIDNKWCVTDSAATDYKRGGSNYQDQQSLLNSYGIRNGIVMGYNEQAIANLIKGGRGVMIAVNSGKLWADSNYLDDGAVNHVVTVTGVACDAATGAINGFYIADSGRGLVSDMTRYVSASDFRNVASVTNGYTIYTIEPIKLWEENINATGNELGNVITGNRGNNVLTGGKGNDTLLGLAGNDTYVFKVGDGQDTLIDSDATANNTDVLKLTDIKRNSLWFKQVGNDLQMTVQASTDQVTIKNWYVKSSDGVDNRIESIKTADGFTLTAANIEKAVQDMKLPNGLNYIASYGDLITAFGVNAESGVKHFVNSGYWEGRRATFNGLNYIASYGDLIKAFGTNEQAGVKHFITDGYKETRKATFNGLNYIASYGDLIKAFGTNEQAGVKHFITDGYKETRKATFNGLNYIASYGDLMKAFGTNEQAGVKHFITDGYKEARKATFNAEFYLQKYADVRKAFGTDSNKATVHYIQYGYAGGRVSVNTGNDNLLGTVGSDRFVAGKGTDTLTGLAGNDTYVFAKGDGQDKLIDADSTAGNMDVLQLAGVNQTNLWLKHVGNDLQINVLGSTDQITVKDWYVGGSSGADNQIERIQTADGLTMYNTDVEKFVQAMSAFSPPAATQTSWKNGDTSNGKVLMTVTH